MAKYRKKPIVIEAVQWFKEEDHPIVSGIPCGPAPKLSGKFAKFKGRDFPMGDTLCEQCKQPRTNHGLCPTLEGEHIVCPADWIITGIEDENYPCKPDIFEATYELVEDA